MCWLALDKNEVFKTGSIIRRNPSLQKSHGNSFPRKVTRTKQQYGPMDYGKMERRENFLTPGIKHSHISGKTELALKI